MLGHTGEVLRVALGLSAVVVLLLAAVWGFQRRLIYFPSDAPVPPAPEVIAGGRDVVLSTGDGLELGAWYVPAGKPDRHMAVLVAPGNAGDRAGRAPLAEALANQGLSVLLLDYRGYGGNPGRPSEEGLASDVRAARSFLIDDIGIRPDRLLYYGESLGAAVVTELATQHPPAGMLLRSPFTSLAAAGQVHYPYLPVRALLWDSYPVARQIEEVTAPVSVVYGTTDSVIPPSQSRAVAAAAPVLRQVVPIRGADHNDLVLFAGKALVDAVVDLADHAAPRSVAEPKPSGEPS